MTPRFANIDNSGATMLAADFVDPTRAADAIRLLCALPFDADVKIAMLDQCMKLTGTWLMAEVRKRQN